MMGYRHIYGIVQSVRVNERCAAVMGSLGKKI